MMIIVAGIGTDVGKTVISAILCQALKAQYWKPVQAGDLDNTDSDTLRNLVSYAGFHIHEETHRLTKPMSPHAAAHIDGVSINAQDFTKPDTRGLPLVTELAGGLMVPLSSTYLTIDLAADLGGSVILVVNSYLGSINHTLLSLDLLKRRGLPVAGLIFNGDINKDSRDVILNYSDAHLIAEVPRAAQLDKAFIKTYADKIQNHPRLAYL
ncbi:MAG: dethiobiotin synthase [Robiginitomaculum sp.]|nr:dethiobiotin synthase [Robiginitomaculum sp.]